MYILQVRDCCGFHFEMTLSQGFVQFELTKGSERSAGDMLRSAQTAGQAGAIVSSQYERPAAVQEAATNRAALAESYMSDGSRPVGSYGSTPATAASDGSRPVGPYGSTPAAGANADGAGNGSSTSRIHVEVTLPNAPAGTQAKVRSTDGNVTAITRIGYSGVGALA